ncbi:alpha/beta hydrolase family esterase [Leisingera sp. ANG-M7]|uniref:alpha/beta hydrolase family esterase n=1 Tax=Leisingera sp. ANG-M7 TaxID=1577902 RepID=UPI00057D689E|nr:alpha/beta fold hydrolase [Leisingera sp. ANG-M7]KIC37175.1 polyhydroxybutyrate depolymerase [Leisingera sp. ANG-M7]
MKRGLRNAVAAAMLAAAWGNAASAGCGKEQDACSVEEGAYHIVLPDQKTAASAVPVVMFLHGYGGSGGSVLRNKDMIEGLTQRGYAVIAPEGQRRGGSGPQSWGFGPFTGGRDEGAFFAAVLADAAERFGTSRSQTVLAGFSAGAFMVHYLACRDPAAFAAYAPVSGAFWRPQPERCAGPLRLLQVHGWRDEVVPLEGRVLGGGRFEQGDVFAALEVWREANACTFHAPDRAWSTGGLMRRRWDCGPGADIELVLFDGGHMVPKGWAGLMAEWFEDQPAVR